MVTRIRHNIIDFWKRDIVHNRCEMSDILKRRCVSMFSEMPLSPTIAVEWTDFRGENFVVTTWNLGSSPTAGG